MSQTEIRWHLFNLEVGTHLIISQSKKKKDINNHFTGEADLYKNLGRTSQRTPNILLRS